MVRDVAFSVVALVLTAVLVTVGIVRAVRLVGFLGECERCNSSAAVVSVGGPVVVAVAAGFAGLVLTALRVVDRRASWPFALVTLLLCTLAIGFERYGVSEFTLP